MKKEIDLLFIRPTTQIISIKQETDTIPIIQGLQQVSNTTLNCTVKERKLKGSFGANVVFGIFLLTRLIKGGKSSIYFVLLFL